MVISQNLKKIVCLFRAVQSNSYDLYSQTASSGASGNSSPPSSGSSKLVEVVPEEVSNNEHFITSGSLPRIL